jgi:predicted nucleic-acid-binding protein
MIGVDTNVLVRFVVEDDLKQTKRADALFRRAIAKGEHVFISDVVLCELVWVLDAAYRVPREEIADALANVIRAKEVEIGEADAVHRALGAYRAGRGDFADYVIRERALGAGCLSIATFDKRLWAERGFEKA